VFEKSSTNVGGQFSTVIHLSSCLIHKVAIFESLFVVACNSNELVVWDRDIHHQYTQVGVFELSGFDVVTDLVLGVSCFRDQAVLLNHHHHRVPEVSVIKVEEKKQRTNYFLFLKMFFCFRFL
jgi:hypothetical protein